MSLIGFIFCNMDTKLETKAHKLVSYNDHSLHFCAKLICQFAESQVLSGRADTCPSAVLISCEWRARCGGACDEAFVESSAVLRPRDSRTLSASRSWVLVMTGHNDQAHPCMHRSARHILKETGWNEEEQTERQLKGPKPHPERALGTPDTGVWDL